MNNKNFDFDEVSNTGMSVTPEENAVVLAENNSVDDINERYCKTWLRTLHKDRPSLIEVTRRLQGQKAKLKSLQTLDEDISKACESDQNVKKYLKFLKKNNITDMDNWGNKTANVHKLVSRKNSPEYIGIEGICNAFQMYADNVKRKRAHDKTTSWRRTFDKQEPSLKRHKLIAFDPDNYDSLDDNYDEEGEDFDDEDI